MSSTPLFPDLPASPSDTKEEAAPSPPPSGRPRLREPDRRSVRLMAVDLDSLIPADHTVRAVWAYVLRLDLQVLEDAVAARGSHPGRPATDPRLLLALWLFATLEGVGSARALERLCDSHLAYRWLCGGVSVNHRMLGEFRVAHVELLDQLLTLSISALWASGTVDLVRVAQDGMRVRASAGAGSHHRRKTIEKSKRLATEQVQRLKAELESDSSATHRRQEAARLRAAEERDRRLSQALLELEKVEAKQKDPKRRKGKGKSGPDRTDPPGGTAGAPAEDSARVSTTDPEARVMKMADGGYRPAYNVQLCSDTKGLAVVGVEVTSVGSDQPHLVPMAEQVERRVGVRPAEMLVDGGFVNLASIEALGQQGVAVLAPVPSPRGSNRDPHVPLDKDTPHVAAWRQRMGTDEAKATYKLRAATAECVNAQMRGRGLQQFFVRGLRKVRAVVLWHALAHNLRRILTLAPHAVLAT